MIKPLLDTGKPELIVREGDKIFRYIVVEEEYKVDRLEADKVRLEEEVLSKEPSLSELTEVGKSLHPFFQIDKTLVQNSLDKITNLLETKDGDYSISK